MKWLSYAETFTFNDEMWARNVSKYFEAFKFNPMEEVGGLEAFFSQKVTGFCFTDTEITQRIVTVNEDWTKSTTYRFRSWHWTETVMEQNGGFIILMQSDRWRSLMSWQFETVRLCWNFVQKSTEETGKKLVDGKAGKHSRRFHISFVSR